MRLDLSPDEVLTTTRTVRRRLDLERPVERSVVEECLKIAFQAPNGSNGQTWGWVLVDDPTLRRQMADLYLEGQRDHARMVSEGKLLPVTHHMSGQTQPYEDLGRVPILLVPTIDQRFGTESSFQQASRWGSILPAVWSFMLALRSRGLGSAWTTLHLHREKEMARLLDIPYPEHTQAGMFPVAYTIGTDFRPANRELSQDRVFWNQWGNS